MKKSILLIFFLFLSGCGIKPPPLPNLDRISIPSKWSNQKIITLQDGSYSEKAAPHSASKTTIHTTKYFARGTIDGQKVLAAILITTSGGSTTFYDLFLFSEENNAIKYITQLHLLPLWQKKHFTGKAPFMVMTPKKLQIIQPATLSNSITTGDS